VELAIVKELDKVALALAVQLALDGKAIEQGTSTQLIRCIGSGRQVDVHSSVQVAKNATLEGIARGQLSNDLLQHRQGRACCEIDVMGKETGRHDGVIAL
jgi:hypothetical protein